MFNKSAADRTKTPMDTFSILGRLVVRAPWLMIAAWIAVVVVLSIVFTPLTKVVENQTMQPLPPQAMAATEQMAKDFHESAQNILVVVMTDEHGLTPADNDTYRALADKLRGDATDVSAVQDFISTPVLRQLMVSTDNKAFYMAVTLKAPAGSPQSSQAYQRIAQIVEQSTAGSALTAHVTGQAAIVGDMSIVTARDMHVIEIATALLVLIILLVILPATHYRVTSPDHDRCISRISPRVGVRADRDRSECIGHDDRVDDGDDRRRRHGLRCLPDQPLPRVHPVRYGLRRGCAASAQLDRQGDRRVGGHGGRDLPRYDLHPTARVHECGSGACGFDRSRVRRGRDAVARRSGAGGPARVGRAAAGAHRPTVAALGDSRSSGGPRHIWRSA